MPSPRLMPFDVAAWKQSTRVGVLTPAARCGYIEILFAMWSNGGALPDDDAQLQFASRLPDRDWKRSKAHIRAMLVEGPEPNTLTSARLLAEYGKTVELIEKKRAAANQRWSQQSTHSPKRRTASNAPASHPHMQTHPPAHAPRHAHAMGEGEGEGEGEGSSSLRSEDAREPAPGFRPDQALQRFLDRWLEFAPERIPPNPYLAWVDYGPKSTDEEAAVHACLEAFVASQDWRKPNPAIPRLDNWLEAQHATGFRARPRAWQEPAKPAAADDALRMAEDRLRRKHQP